MNNNKNKINLAEKNTNLIKDKSEQAPLFIVVIGASVGRLDILKSFFSKVLPSPSIAYVIITHLCPHHPSQSPELIKEFSSLNVLSIDKPQLIEPNSVYVSSPGRFITLQDNMLELAESQEDIEHPMDFFLRTLAVEKNREAICIILSGTGTDGAIGLRALREKGGLIIVQSAKSAHYDGMPKSAMSTGLVDYILAPEQMFPFLIQYINHTLDKTIPVADSISNEINQILTLLHGHISHDFSSYKPNTIFRRIQKRLNLLQIDSLSFYIHYLQQNPVELNILFKELLINVTNFFRDPAAFQALKNEIIEKILKNKPMDLSVRVWVPGCSTGEEAYSIAILLQECMLQLKKHFNVQIFGTDIDEDAIEIARAGIFSPHLLDGLTSEQRDRFFTKEGDDYKVSSDIRKMIIFATQNLVKDPPFTRLDLLSCRNLLIYLNAQLQKKILPLFHYSLKANGLLFLGTSETIGNASDLFTMIDRRWKIFESKCVASSFNTVLDIPSSSLTSDIIGTKIMEKITPEVEPSLANLVEHILLKNYTPACIIIDDKGKIIYIYGRTGRFLEFAPGEVKLHFSDMVRPELKVKIASTIRKATTMHKEIILNGVQYKENNEFHYLNLKIRPLIEAETLHQKLILIVFEEIATFKGRETNGKLPTKGELDKKIIQLEQELKYSKESLQTTIEELETSNEELKSSNEELQSTNEELQSTNEEIETSKEELQSLNEELTTVNAELESRIEQLSSANDDIRNLLDNTEIATVFLDKDLCIKRFTPKATEIINLIATDVGRPLGHIVSNLKYDDLIEDSRNVLRSLESKAIEVMDKSGHWYIVRMIPYRTVKNIIDGVVITFLNNHAQKSAENQLKTLEGIIQTGDESCQSAFNFIQQPILILNKDGTTHYINQAFETYFKTSSEEKESKKLTLNWNKDLIRKAFNECDKTKETFIFPLEQISKNKGSVCVSSYLISKYIFLIKPDS
jgi:two-component system CheB/CheR fusion protein